MKNLNRALAEWRMAIGSKYVITEPEQLSIRQTATFKTSQRVLAIIRPGKRSDVQKCLQISNHYKIPVYPISTGKNWGYGSGVPVSDQCVVMELARLNRIVDFDEKLAYVTIEPGVTFRRLNDFLTRKKSKLIIAFTGSTVDSSIIGNTLERGVGRGPKGDRVSYVCGLEVVLPTGECIHTGFDAFRNAKTGRIARWGLGPSLDGIFTQSSFGVITQLTAWLTPISEHFHSLHFLLRDERRLGDLIDSLQRLTMSGLLQCSFNMWNVHRTLSLFQQYPWKDAKGRTPLPEAFVRAAKKQFGAWNGGAWFSSQSEEHARVQKKLIGKAMKTKVDKLTFNNFTHAAMDLTDKNILQTYWRKKMPRPETLDPDRDRCGVIWCSPAVPFRGKDVVGVLTILKGIMKTFRFEPNFGLLFISERLIYITASILFDRETPNEDDHALECYEKMFQTLTSEGYYPYRIGIQSMESLEKLGNDSSSLLSRIKDVIDPNHILAPRRYQ